MSHRGAAGRDRQRVRLAVLERANPLQADLDGVETFHGEVLQDLSGRGRLHAAGMALEQSNAQLGLQARDVLTDRRLRPLQFARQRAHAARLARRHQDSQVFQRHGPPISRSLDYYTAP
jgi:hypothetical protein